MQQVSKVQNKLHVISKIFSKPKLESDSDRSKSPGVSPQTVSLKDLQIHKVQQLPSIEHHYQQFSFQQQPSLTTEARMSP